MAGKTLERPRYGLDSAVFDVSSAFEHQGVVSQIRAILPLLDMERGHIAYVRKSNPRGDAAQGNLLKIQHTLHLLIAEAGVPSDKIRKMDEDVGISAIYDSSVRRDMARIEESLVKGEKELGTIWTQNIARLWRDPTYVFSTVFGARLASNKVKIVTFETGRPEIIDMATRSGYDTYIRLTQTAAQQRLAFRLAAIMARQEAVKSGEWSGSPLPIGWILVPPKQEAENGRMVVKAARPIIYPPHASIKLEIMQMGVDPRVKGMSQLHRDVMKRGLTIPPFPEDIREYMATRSALKNAVSPGQVYDPSQPWPISKWMLHNLLLDPLTIGMVNYGSGEAGAREWAALERKYERMCANFNVEIPIDSYVRDYREHVREDPELALLPSDSELYWHLFEKYGRHDTDKARDSKFSVMVPKADMKRGRPAGSGPANHWVGKMLCGLHDDDLHILSFNPGIRKDRENNTPRWVCTRDFRLADTLGAKPCISVGGQGGVDFTTQVLDTHVLSRLRWAVDQSLEENKTDDGRSKRQMALELERKNIDTLTARLSRLNRTLVNMQDRWAEEGLTEDEIDQQTEQWMKDNVLPTESALRAAKRQVQLLEGEPDPAELMSLDRSAAMTLAAAIEKDWGRYSVAARKLLVGTFIKYVRIWTDKEPVHDEVWVQMEWIHGTDILLFWRNPHLDKREWTAEEDEALKQLWTTDCSWEEIAAHLQPGRRFHLAYRRARKLNAAKGARNEEWRDAANTATKSYGQKNPDTLYMRYDSDGSWLEIFEDGSARRWDNLPEGITLPAYIQDLCTVVNKSAATSNPLFICYLKTCLPMLNFAA